ncbi:Transmembrane amino acid transporter protein [Aphelenchoides fujianensis]|nr:Transmembrane amino acid transporter protein [Aphelenchoides fujianensis]
MSFLKQKNAVYSVSFSEAADEKPPPSPPPPFSDGSIALTSSSGTIGTFNRPRVRSDAKGGTIIEGENPHADGYFDAQGRYIRSHGLHWIITGLFVVGFYYGMVGILVMCFVAGYTSYALGLSWMILLRRWPEYRSHTRKPYPELAYRACGARVKFITSASILVTQFGVSVVYLLLSAKNIRDFVETFFHKSFSYCYVIMIVALVLTPVMFLKSPADFWAAVVLAMFTTSAAVMLIIIGASMDHEACAPHKDMPEFHPVNYFLALGTLIFSFGGHAAFPIIFPCIFYLYLDAIDRKTREKGDIGEAEPVTFKEVIRGTDRVTLGICCFIIVVGTVGGAAATFSAINGLSTTHFVPPCYLQPFLHHADDAAASTSSINCCGHFQNVTAREGIVCSTADMKFYG